MAYTASRSRRNWWSSPRRPCACTRREAWSNPPAPRGTRRYSDADLDRIRRIGELLAGGLNLAGIKAVLELELENQRLRAELDDTRNRLEYYERP
ncbi:hypothetical protein GCM10029992_34620 [Glycomyces albus]